MILKTDYRNDKGEKMEKKELLIKKIETQISQWEYKIAETQRKCEEKIKK